MTRSGAAVHIEGLSVRRGRRTILHGVGFSIERGAVVGLLGPSGCGKTTLMRAIVGVQRSVNGTVNVLGKPAGSSQLRKKVGYVTQSASVYSDLTVHQNLAYFQSILGAPREDIDRVIDATRLGGQRTQRVDSLSEGQRSRVSLAAALLGQPEILVLDEPTVGLDPVLRSELWEVMRGFADAGTTLLISSHVMDEATHCDRLLLMRDGRLIADDTLAGLRTATGATDAEGAFLAIVSGAHNMTGDQS